MATELSIELNFRNQRFLDAQKGLTAFAANLEQSVEKLSPILKQELLKFLQVIATAMAQRHGFPWPLGTSPTNLASRSGRAVDSIQKSIQVTGDSFSSIEGRIGGIYYLNVHEYGATISARRARYLTIPLEAALDSRGVPIKASAREWDRTFVAKSKKGNLLIFRKEGRKIVPLYLLKDTVKIPPRLGMRDTIEKGLPYFIDTVTERMTLAIINQYKGA